MEIGALELQWSENALEDLLTPAGISGQLTACTTRVPGFAIGVIGVEALLDGTAGQVQRLTPYRDLQRSQIKFLQALPPQQRVDIPEDLSGE